jgi:hypothetical protein
VFAAPPDERIPSSGFVVRAGVSNLNAEEPGEQDASVESVRVHPYYAYTPNSGHVNPDDVAILTLTQPLSFDASTSAIPLAPPGLYPAEGASLSFTGFGEQSAGAELDGKLYSLGMTALFARECGGENGVQNAVLVCANAPSGSPCSGDSGSALTIPTPSPMLIGVMDAGAVVVGRGCSPGARNSFANLAAPEIQDFLDGSESPPQAPRGGGARCLAPSPTVGESMTCGAGTWSNNPTFTYVFLDGATGQVLQSGASASYRFPPAVEGHAISMRLLASNEGGTGVDRTPPTTPVAADESGETEQPEVSARVSLADASVVVQRDGLALVKLRCGGSGRCEGKLTLTAGVISKARGGKRRSRTIELGTLKFRIAAGRQTIVRLKLSKAGFTLLGAHGGRLTGHLAILEIETGSKLTHSRKVLLVEQKAKLGHRG